MTPNSSSLDALADAEAELLGLRTAAREVLTGAWSPAAYRSLLDQPVPAFDPELWDEIRKLGWADVLVAENNGGGGGGMRQLAVLMEEVGVAGAPVPLRHTAAAAWYEEKLDEGLTLLLDGECRLTDGRVTGRFEAVPYAEVATRFIVSAADRDGAVGVAVIDAASHGVRREAVTPLDRNPAANVQISDAAAVRLDEGPTAAARLADGLARVRLATVAELVGIAAAANVAAVDYAKVRIAFGRPIGQFQAIKHRLVDQRAAIEVARALVNRAGGACDNNDPDWRALVSLATFWAIDSLRRVPEGAIQVFGGIGYTWEHEAHAHLRRAATLVAGLGRRADHRAACVRWLRATAERDYLAD